MSSKNPKGAGRKTLPPGEKMKGRLIYMTDAQWAFVQQMGGSKFVRQLIEIFRKGRD